ncbi:MAG TPA: response regulator transcription factor [Chitinophagaceae bacterium]|jgi:DNA-binding NarL/FixJ family response regulator
MNDACEIKLLIADDHKVVLDGLVALLQAEPGFIIGATAYNGSQVLALSGKQPYDVCLLDISMPELDGIDTAKWLKKERPDIKIIILTTYSEKEIITRLLQIGVDGYLLKNSTRQELVTAIKKVAAGGHYFSNEVHDSILADYSLPGNLPGNEAVVLTQREKEILSLLAKEYTNEKIASALHISFRTVETHRKNMMQKTGASNLAGLLRYAYGKGLLK